MMFVPGLCSALLLCTGLASVLGQDSGDMPFNETLDSAGNVSLRWGFDSKQETITFQLACKTRGWVGFGLSPSGEMDGSDIVIGGVNPNGTTYFTDRHAVDAQLPLVDGSQDYTLLSLKEDATRTTMKFSRKVQTCDKDDMEISFAVPERDTCYHCRIIKSPDFPGKRHVYRIEPKIQSGNVDLIHHMLVYACPASVSVELEGECYSGQSMYVFSSCQQVVIGWAVGGQAIQEAERLDCLRKPDRTPTGVDPQPGPLADPEPGILADPELGLLADTEPGLWVDLLPYLLANPEPGPVADLEPGFLVDLEPGPLSHPEPGPLANPEVQSMANPLVDMVVNPDNEHGAQYLPSEILSKIIELSLNLDISMLGTFNRVSLLFRELSRPYHPNLYIREALAESLELDKENDCSISVMKLYKAAGRSSGLSTRIKELFGKDKRWMRAWILLSHIAFRQYKVKDIYWKM
ncbi:UNVERIFIED_CONTAM: hypothetical protein FKN15_060698 [Acipenser sinensis]